MVSYGRPSGQLSLGRRGEFEFCRVPSSSPPPPPMDFIALCDGVMQWRRVLARVEPPSRRAGASGRRKWAGFNSRRRFQQRRRRLQARSFAFNKLSRPLCVAGGRPSRHNNNDSSAPIDARAAAAAWPSSGGQVGNSRRQHFRQTFKSQVASCCYTFCARPRRALFCPPSSRNGGGRNRMADACRQRAASQPTPAPADRLCHLASLSLAARVATMAAAVSGWPSCCWRPPGEQTTRKS